MSWRLEPVDPKDDPEWYAHVQKVNAQADFLRKKKQEKKRSERQKEKSSKEPAKKSTKRKIIRRESPIRNDGPCELHRVDSGSLTPATDFSFDIEMPTAGSEAGDPQFRDVVHPHTGFTMLLHRDIADMIEKVYEIKREIVFENDEQVLQDLDEEVKKLQSQIKTLDHTIFLRFMQGL